MAGIALFGLLDANTKLLSGEFSPAQALVFRHGVLLALLFSARVVRPGLGGTLRTHHPWLHALRALSMLGSGMMFFLTFRHLPLADGYLVFFTNPFLIMLMTSVFLGERVPRSAWLWSGVGFCGVLLALAPQLGNGGSLFGFGCALLGTVFYSINITINRALRGETGYARLLVWPSALGLVVFAPFAAWLWVTPDAVQTGQLVANGLMAGLATVTLALAFRHASPARLAPFEFIALPWSVALDWLIFGNAPEPMLILGGVVVVLACVMSERAGKRPYENPSGKM
jgi:drug/metabolite transporter (DMT)-like permease